MRTRV